MVREEFYPSESVNSWKDKVNGVIESIGLNPKEVLGKIPTSIERRTVAKITHWYVNG